MPCDTITSAQVDVSKMDKEKLIEGLRADGATVQPNGYDNTQLLFQNHPVLGTGTLSMTTGKLNTGGRLGSNEGQQALAECYGRGVVKATAKRFGWKLTQKSSTKFVIQKGGSY